MFFPLMFGHSAFMGAATSAQYDSVRKMAFKNIHASFSLMGGGGGNSLGSPAMQTSYPNNVGTRFSSLA